MVHSEEAVSIDNTSSIRKALESLLNDIRDTSETASRALQYSTILMGDGDYAEDATEIDVVAHRLTLTSHVAVAIAHALARIDEGTYGWCEDCESRISSAR